MKQPSVDRSSMGRKIGPGLLVAIVIAVISQGLAQVIPLIGGPTIAILLGIVLGNTFIRQPQLEPGTRYAESKLLEFSVVLLGATVTVQTISQIGWSGIAFILCQMTITILAAIGLGKALHFNEGTTLLMAGGNAVCGSSAIAAIAPAIEADEADRGMVITLVNLMGTVLMLGLPIVGQLVFGGVALTKGALIGGTLQSVGQVVASASMINPATVQFATLFKIMRIMMLVVVVFLFARLHAKHLATEAQEGASISGNGSGKVLPWYVAAFLVLCLINSLIRLPHVFSASAHWVSSWCEITALAAIGLRLNLQAFLRAGKRFALYGLGVGTVQVVAALLLIAVLIH